MQWEVVQSLWDRNCSICRLAEDVSGGCGMKLGSVQEDLDSLELVFGSLGDLVYGTAKQRMSLATCGTRTEVVPLVAERVVFPGQLRGFDATPFIPEPFREAYSSPSKLLQPDRQPLAVPPVTTNRAELWHLCWRWGSVDRLLLAAEDEIDERWLSNLFCLEKPDKELRQIIDRRPSNSLESPPPSNGSRKRLLGLERSCQGLPKGGLRDFYHGFRVSMDRAYSTPVGFPLVCLGFCRL